MQKLKDIDRRILSLLTRHSKASDRQIAREIGVSQPTVTRRRTKLEESLINTYTIVPDFLKLGYQIMAFTFVKLRSYPAAEKAEALVAKGTAWLKTYPNVIFAADGEGLGKDLIMVSFHKNYSAYSDFMRSYAMEWGELISDLGSFLVSLGSGFKIRPFDLKYLAEDV